MFLKLTAVSFLVYIFDFPISVIIILMHRTLCRAHILREQQYVPVFLFFWDFFFLSSMIFSVLSVSIKYLMLQEIPLVSVVYHAEPPIDQTQLFPS